MAKKTKPGKRQRGLSTTSSQTEQVLASIAVLTALKDYEGVVAASTSLLSYLPQHSSQRLEVLVTLGSAQTMLENYPEAFEAFSEALDLNPFDVDLWFNRGQLSYCTMRFGRSYKDYMRALELNKDDPQFTRQIEKSLKLSRKMVGKALKLRAPDFTLDQLIEQEDHYQRGLELFKARRWHEAEEELKVSIAMSDCLPQPWNNLGSCLMMQERFDEAEEAWKHALKINRYYSLARSNLKLLPDVRKNGLPQHFAVYNPMLKRSMEPMPVEDH